ncbi:hypothetical protein [Lacticaseibacillus sp. 53-4]|uniref:hypothetical protein n=1 Tax=Lacticaseibacillus sp. 53-4 TaxID=2799575 RepID=UPI001942E4C3|nr:hypothetical protein [Lacticaseibacillus sp. 53-4]
MNERQQKKNFTQMVVQAGEVPTVKLAKGQAAKPQTLAKGAVRRKPLKENSQYHGVPNIEALGKNLPSK